MKKTEAPEMSEFQRECDHCLGTGKVADMKRLGKKMKSLREMLNLKQGCVAAAMGLSGGYVSELESGKKNWTTQLIRDYKTAIGANNS